MFEIMMEAAIKGLAELGVNQGDIKWLSCRPDIRYPIQTKGGTVLWGYDLIYDFTDGRRASKSIIFTGDTCAAFGWRPDCGGDHA